MRITGKYLNLLFRGHVEGSQLCKGHPLCNSMDDAEEVEIRRETLWTLLRPILRLGKGEAWAWDCLWLAMNWGRCREDGKHPDTAVEEWDFLNDVFPNSYSEHNCKILFARLCDERLCICFNLLFTFCVPVCAHCHPREHTAIPVSASAIAGNQYRSFGSYNNL